MKKLTVSFIVLSFMGLSSFAFAGETKEERVEIKIQEKQLNLLSNQVKKERLPAGKIYKQIKKRQEVLRSNGKLERLYGFSISL